MQKMFVGHPEMHETKLCRPPIAWLCHRIESHNCHDFSAKSAYNNCTNELILILIFFKLQFQFLNWLYLILSLE